MKLSRSVHPAWLVAALLAISTIAATGCPQVEPEKEKPAADKPVAQAPASGAAPGVIPPIDNPPTDAPPDGQADISPPRVALDGGETPVAPPTPTDEPGPAFPDPGASPPPDHPPKDPPSASGEEPGHPQHGAYDKHPKVDPVEANGPIFEGWKPPDVALLISGEQIGYIEPCGCAGLENQKGGLSRRHTLLRQLREAGWPVVALDLGGQVRRFGPQAEMKYRTALGALATLDYSAVGFGPQDLRLPAEHLVLVAADLAEGKKVFVAANVDLLEFGSGFVDRYRVIEAGGKKIGVTSILGEKHRARVNNDGVAYEAPDKALAKVVDKLAAEADFLVLLAHATPEESKDLARRFPQFNVVVTAGGAEEPPREAAVIEGTKGTRLVEVGHKGMYVAVLGLYDEGEPKLRYQRVPLDARFKDSDAMKAMLARYQKELETVGLDGLGLSPQAHPSGRKFIGSATCGDCHSKAYNVWKNTPHAHATQTLVDLTPARHFDPECLSCHATGWNPQKYFPFDSGYLDLKASAHLRANGCENCHGPGEQHALAELGEIEVTEDQQKSLREQMQIRLIDGELEGTKVGAVVAKCVECHDPDNSPDFEFTEYWDEVKHYGKD